MGSITTNMILAILPEILLVVLALLVLAIDLIVKPEWRRNLAWVTASGILIIMGVTLLVARPAMQAEYLWGGMVRWDWAGFVFGQLFMFGAAITALIGMDVDGLGDRGEFYILLLASTVGMTLLASAADLIMIYLSLETVAIPLYVLAGFLLHSDRSVEAGFKYLLFGAMSSAFLLYGFTLLFGFTGTTNLYEIVSTEYMQSIVNGAVSKWPLIGILVLILVGFSFKISAVPLHFWAPDVYEGSPSPVAGFLSTASKAAGFVILMRVLLNCLPGYQPAVGGGAGCNFSCYDDARKLARPGAEEPQAYAGIFIDRTRRVCINRNCIVNGSWNNRHCFVPDWIPGIEPGSLRSGQCLQ